MSRAAIKREFRADQTVLLPSDSNPLKFAVTSEEAIAALLRPGRPGYLQPLAATSEAFADLKAHELAVMAGLQTALTNLLRRINPNALEEQHRAGPVGSLLPLATRRAAGSRTRTTYKEITREAEDSFSLAFGRDFARAYEQQARRV